MKVRVRLYIIPSSEWGCNTNMRSNEWYEESTTVEYVNWLAYHRYTCKCVWHLHDYHAALRVWEKEYDESVNEWVGPSVGSSEEDKEQRLSIVSIRCSSVCDHPNRTIYNLYKRVERVMINWRRCEWARVMMQCRDEAQRLSSESSS